MRWADRTGQSLRRLDGWSPRTRSWVDEDGCSWSQAEPEFDWVDLALLRAWWSLVADTCQLCGRPRAAHEIDESEVHVGFEECPYSVALIRAQTARRLLLDEERERVHKADPNDPEGHWAREQASTWTTWTDDEIR